VLQFNDFDAVLDEANSTEYGLSASVWTNDLQKALHATRKLEAGKWPTTAASSSASPIYTAHAPPHTPYRTHRTHNS
jgi:hypothetical protein